MDIQDFLIQYHPDLSEYCRILILTDGTIEICDDGHLNKMIELYGDHQILSRIPDGEAPLFWLCRSLSCVVVDYENQIFSGELTKDQESVLEILEQNKLIVKHRSVIK